MAGRTLLCAVAVAVLLAGCDKPARPYPPKAPLAVSVMTVQKSSPTSARRVAGSVQSWKTEDIGFEVSGRILWVVEPGFEIEGRAFDENGNMASEGTPLAQIDPARFETAVETAKAQLKIAELREETTRVQIENGLPAEFDAARADLQLAKTAYEREVRLFNQNAGAKAEVDQAEAAYKAAQAKIKSLEAKQESSKAELGSAKTAIKQAQQSLIDAERNLRDTKLFSSFRGQVASVKVVPGSIAAQGNPVLTVQMMNPIKIDVQVSANFSRQLHLNDTVPITLTTSVGESRTVQAIVYKIGAAANTATRTFSLTLLSENTKVPMPIPDGIDEATVGRTQRLWNMNFRLLNETPEGTYYMPESGIFSDDDGAFVWRVTNLRKGEPSRRVLKVKKLRVTLGETRMPFLGKELFRTLTVNDGQNFDPVREFVLSKMLNNKEGTWDGDTVLLDGGGDWLMRPGDVVEVSLASESNPSGLYVPIEAIHEEAGETFVFVVQPEADTTTVKRVAVEIQPNESGDVSSRQRITAKGGEELEGRQIVVEGVHYLADGQEVSIVNDGASE